MEKIGGGRKIGRNSGLRGKEFFSKKSVAFSMEEKEVGELDEFCRLMGVRRGELLRDIVLRYLREMEGVGE